MGVVLLPRTEIAVLGKLFLSLTEAGGVLSYMETVIDGTQYWRNRRTAVTEIETGQGRSKIESL